MAKYFNNPFPFYQIMRRSKSIAKLSLDESIRSHLESLVLMRIGEFAYDRELGFVLWDYDKEVFYHEREPYFEKKKKEKGFLESGNAQKHFKDNLLEIIRKNELRLDVGYVNFKFDRVEGNLSVYQRKISIEVGGRIKSTGQILKPPFQMSILYTPFKVDRN